MPRPANVRGERDSGPIFLDTNDEYHFAAAPEAADPSLYVLYRIHRWSARPAEIVKRGIDLEAARELAGAAA